jgi:hypothetical protein
MRKTLTIAAAAASLALLTAIPASAATGPVCVVGPRPPADPAIVVCLDVQVNTDRLPPTPAPPRVP